MIEINNISVYNFENALRGARNPLESWNKTDSYFDEGKRQFILGQNDLKLAQKLILAGSDHRKFMRQILVSIDITAPLYWWKEFDTYKVSTVANSTSTMHTIHKKPISLDMFSIECEKIDTNSKRNINDYINLLESIRQTYLNNDVSIGVKQNAWKLLIQLLPSSFNQLRTVTLNYEVLRNMYFSRRTHKLSEWREFCTIIETLPYAKELICLEKDVN